METPIPINEIFADDVTVITSTNMGVRGDPNRMKNMVVWQLVDHLGEMSSKEQGLNKVITTATKLQKSEHRLYLLKDPHGNGGKGEAIGFLKAGRKHLFVYNPNTNSMQEHEPWSVLDFFVLPGRQRHGYGKKLFDYMLEDQKIPPHTIAIDGPSPKMENFLIKNYGFEKLCRQSNNFAVSIHFFNFNKDAISDSGVKTPVATPVGRYSAHAPQSSIANVIHGSAGNVCVAHGKSAKNVEVDVAHQELPVPQPEPQLQPEPELEPEQEAPETVSAQDQQVPMRPNTLEVETRPCDPPLSSRSHSPFASPAGMASSRRPSQLTEKGYFDVKNYHNKLW